MAFKIPVDNGLRSWLLHKYGSKEIKTPQECPNKGSYGSALWCYNFMNCSIADKCPLYQRAVKGFMEYKL